MTQLIRSILFFIFSIFHFQLFAQNQAYVNTPDSLYLIDVSTCRARTIGKLDTVFLDIAMNPVSKILYGIGYDYNLYKISRIDATISLINNIPVYLNSLTFSKKGVLYAMGQGDRIYTIDLFRGTATHIGNTSLWVDPDGDIALLNGKLYLSAVVHVPYGSKLVEIDIKNLNKPNFPNTKNKGRFNSLSNVFGLASIGCSPELYAFSGKNVYKVPNQNPAQRVLQCSNIIPGNILGTASLAEDIDFSSLDLVDTTHICRGDNAILDARVRNASYVWQDNATVSQYTASTSGLYSVTVSINNCTQTDSAFVYVTDYPSLDLGKDTTLCEGEFLTLDVYQNNSTYLWQDASTDPNYTINQSGIYAVSVTLDNCVSTDSISVSYTSMPDFYWDDYPTTICEGSSFVLDATHMHSSTTYTWQDNSTSPTFWVQQAGIYSVSVSNICGSKTKEIEVSTKECDCFEGIPDIFTPNADGLNDTFGPVTKCDLEIINFEIYNRWGQIVYQTNANYAPWDGQFKGQIAASEVYIYLLQYYDDYGVRVSKRGEVTLAR